MFRYPVVSTRRNVHKKRRRKMKHELTQRDRPFRILDKPWKSSWTNQPLEVRPSTRVQRWKRYRRPTNEQQNDLNYVIVRNSDDKKQIRSFRIGKVQWNKHIYKKKIQGNSIQKFRFFSVIWRHFFRHFSVLFFIYFSLFLWGWNWIRECIQR